ncbi:hypothetical protein FNV43_RR24871 [Rhamnella rubrinervis]|uniref:Uncharacterized protein n=1 Tax=Rhamnella rubrinervis TaxID=2594499 RepID=A0A8K0GR40_9ROSA|nr:hypothetical protein FNV43_RR24871 [Rhamnella rubrinervis]
MSWPVGTVIRLLSSNDMVGSLGKVYQSIENISNTYIQPNIDKRILLNPKIAAVHNNWGVVPLLLSNNGEVLQAHKTMYICSGLANRPSTVTFSNNGYHRYVAQDSTATCPQCSNRMSFKMSIIAGNNKKGYGWTSTSCFGEGDGGFVKGVITYMVMDYLEVTPISTISSVALLNKLNVKEIGAVQEMRVSTGMDEGLKLLKASLETKTVLTDVFLNKKKTIKVFSGTIRRRS